MAQRVKSWKTFYVLRSLKLVCTVLLAVGLATSVHAQAVHHLDEVYAPRTYDSMEEWLGRADSLRTRILVSAGLLPMPERTPLSPRLGEPVEREGYTIQSVVLETFPGLYVTGNLYRPRHADPRDGDGPYPAVLSPHGHWDDGRFEDSESASVPGRAINFARRGYVFLSYSMIGYNETAERIPHRFSDPRYELWGFTPMGLQLWNSLRALDFLSKLPDVDSTRIGMTGASGGATQTFLLTAIDRRIKVSAPVNMISAHMQGGCVCENAPLLRLDATNMDIGAMAAPRPLLMVSTSGDWTSNTPSVEYPAVRSVYRLFGAQDRVRNVHLDYPHNFNRESREAVYAWFDQWLRGVSESETQSSSEISFRAEDPDALWADLPDTSPSLDSLFHAHRSRIIREIRDARPNDWSEIYAYRDRFGVAFRHLFEAAPGVDAVELDVQEPQGRTRAGEAVLIITSGQRLDLEAASDVAAEQHSQGRMVFTLRPYPHDFAVPDSIAHWTTYNATTVARRVDEIRRAVEWIQARPDVTALDIVGLGEAGRWTLLARGLVSNVRSTLIDFAVKDVDAFDPDDDDAAYVDHLFVPLLRRTGDFKTAAVMTAPARLEIRNLEVGPLHTWIRQVYRAAGALEMLRLE